MPNRPFVLLGVERWRRYRRARMLVLSALGALLVAWLQPWQGATLALVVVVTELIAARTRPSAAILAIPGAVAIPAAYYWALSHWDPAWELASKSNAAGSQPTWSWPWWAIALTLAPLAVPAALAYRSRVRDWQEIAGRPGVQVQTIQRGGEVFVLARSNDRAAKETAIRKRPLIALQRSLRRLALILSKGRLKSPRKAYRRLGRLRERELRRRAHVVHEGSHQHG